MKKITTLILLFCMGITTALAQIGPRTQQNNNGFGTRNQNDQTPSTQNDGIGRRPSGNRPDIKLKHYNYELSVGPRAGIGITTMSEGDNFNMVDGSGIGYGAGLAVNMRFGSKDKKGRPLDGQGLFGVGIELNYKNHAANLKTDDKLSLSCFEAPIMLQFYPAYESKQLKNLYVEIGATISGVLSASPESITRTTVDESFNHYYSRVETYDISGIKGMDVKPTIGLGYRFSNNSANDGLYINARYYVGTSDLAGNFPMKASSAELSIGYLFKCIGTKKK